MNKITSSFITVAVLTTFLTGCGKKDISVQTDTKQTEVIKKDTVQTSTNQKTGIKQPETKGNIEKSPAGDKTIIIDLKGDMMCETSEGIIKGALMDVTGVKSTEIDLKNNKAKVIIDPSQTDEGKLEAKIIQTGFDANGKEGDAAAYQRLPACCRTKPNTN